VSTVFRPGPGAGPARGGEQAGGRPDDHQDLLAMLLSSR
jgi:hypothetical protein